MQASEQNPLKWVRNAAILNAIYRVSLQTPGSAETENHMDLHWYY